MHETWFADRVPQSPPDERLPNQGVRLRVRVRVRVCVRVCVLARVRARVRVHVHVHSRPRECRRTVQHLLQAQTPRAQPREHACELCASGRS